MRRSRVSLPLNDDAKPLDPIWDERFFYLFNFRRSVYGVKRSTKELLNEEIVRTHGCHDVDSSTRTQAELALGSRS